MLISAPFGATVARAESGPCQSDKKPDFQSDYRVECVDGKGIKLSSGTSDTNYAITLFGSDQNAISNRQGLNPGESWRKSLGMGLQGRIGSLVSAELQTDFAAAERNPGQLLFALQQPAGTANERREREEFQIKSQFLDDHISLTSSRRASSFAVEAASSEARAARTR